MSSSTPWRVTASGPPNDSCPVLGWPCEHADRRLSRPGLPGRRLQSQLDAFADRLERRWPDAYLASEQAIEEDLQRAAAGGRAARLAVGQLVADPVSWEDALARALLDDPWLPLALEGDKETATMDSTPAFSGRSDLASAGPRPPQKVDHWGCRTLRRGSRTEVGFWGRCRCSPPRPYAPSQPGHFAAGNSLRRSRLGRVGPRSSRKPLIG